MVRADGVRVWDADGREYLDYVMALGAVTLGYGQEEVAQAAVAAIEDGVVGPMAPAAEHQLAELLTGQLGWIEQLRFLKSGAEALAAAVRIARVFTGRDRVIRCGYHGWHDWCQTGDGVPGVVSALTSSIPFNELETGRDAIRQGDAAAVVVEPVVDSAPDPRWLAMLRDECREAGTVLVFDEIKTAFRIAVGGAAERYEVLPDLVVLGKGLANGFPLAVVGGRRPPMDTLDRTWISSTLATEQVSLRAAIASVTVTIREDVPGHLERVGTRLYHGLERLAEKYDRLGTTVRGIPEMCYLHFDEPATGWRLTGGMAGRGIIWKPSAYNFVSLAHSPAHVDRTLSSLDEVLEEMAPPPDEPCHVDRRPCPFLSRPHPAAGLAGSQRQQAPGR